MSTLKSAQTSKSKVTPEKNSGEERNFSPTLQPRDVTLLTKKLHETTLRAVLLRAEAITQDLRPWQRRFEWSRAGEGDERKLEQHAAARNTWDRVVGTRSSAVSYAGNQCGIRNVLSPSSASTECCQSSSWRRRDLSNGYSLSIIRRTSRRGSTNSIEGATVEVRGSKSKSKNSKSAIRQKEFQIIISNLARLCYSFPDRSVTDKGKKVTDRNFRSELERLFE